MTKRAASSVAGSLALLCLLVSSSRFSGARADAVASADATAGSKTGFVFDDADWVYEHGPDYNQEKMMAKSKRHVLAFVDTKQAGVSMEGALAELRKAAKTILDPTQEEMEFAHAQGISRTGAMVFTAVDVHAESSAKLLNRFSVKPEAFSADVTAQLRVLEVYSAGPKVSAPASNDEPLYTEAEHGVVVNFVFALRGRKLARKFMSQPLSVAEKEPDPETGLRTIVGEQYAEITRSHGRHSGVAAFVYLPGCPHCAEFRAKLVRVIAKLKKRKVEAIEFVQMDGAKNESEVLMANEAFTGSYPFFEFCPTVGVCSTFTNYDAGDMDIQVFLQFFRYREAPGPRIFNDDDRRHAAKEKWTLNGEEMNGAVEHLSVFDWEDFLQRNDDGEDDKAGSVVMFYAPWCKASRKTKPHFASASQKMRTVASFGAVNCVLQDTICRDHLTGSFPLIKGFPTGDREGVEYTYRREEEEFIQFTKELAMKTGAFADSSSGEKSEL